MKAIALVTALVALSAAASSCRRDEPEDEDWCLKPSYLVALNVKVLVDDSFHPYHDIDSVYGATRSADETPVLKYYVAAFPLSEYGNTVIESAYTDTVPMFVPPGKYTLMGWVDYELKSTDRGVNFHTDDFSELLLKNKYSYTAAARTKLAFRGSEFRTIPYNAHRDSVQVHPAMGMYRILATDSADYTPAKVTVRYSSPLPSAIDGETGDINWWWDDISFNTVPDGNLIAADFVLAQDTPGTTVRLTVEIYDEWGLLRARKKNVEIPLKNAGITTVRGNFFTTLEKEDKPSGGSGITIKTEWDDTYEIEI